MKRFVRVICSSLLALYVLIGTIGLDTYTHICRVSGATTSLTERNDPCCAKISDNDHHRGEELRRSKCCHLSKNRLEANFEFSHSEKVFVPEAILLTNKLSLAYLEAQQFGTKLQYRLKDKSPPTPGRQILNSVCVLRI